MLQYSFSFFKIATCKKGLEKKTPNQLLSGSEVPFISNPPLSSCITTIYDDHYS